MVESERQLLAAWISGYNQEHIIEFDRFDFFPELLHALKSMKDINIMSVAKETKIPVSEIASMAVEYMPSMYDGAYKIMKQEKIKQMVEKAAIDPKDIQEKLSEISKEMESLNAVKVKKPVDMCEAYENEIERRKTEVPINYGIPSLDYIMGGLRRKELTLISARPSTGKTALSLQIAVNIALNKKKVLFFSLEMAATQLMERIACRETCILHEKLKTPKKMTEKDNEELKDFFSGFKETLKTLMVIDDVNKLSQIERYAKHFEPDVIFIDQISQLNEEKRFKDTRERFTYMSNSLKRMTMELDMPIVVLAQISRSGEDKEPTLSDLKESGSLEEDSDNVIMIHQTGEESFDAVPSEIIIRKQRNGPRDRKIETSYLCKKFEFKEISNVRTVRSL